MTRRGFFGLAAGAVALDPKEAVVTRQNYDIAFPVTAQGQIDWHMQDVARAIEQALRERAKRA
ncbi:MAG: hypothetical protein IT480_18795 [Gammaproteobacteria bacterium]|nr:hypothetical protein [Gammaproteobacteria bacterium]